LYYFHNKFKIFKKPKKTFLVGFFRWVFWVGFLLATLPAAQRSSPHPGLSGRSPPAGRSAASPGKKRKKNLRNYLLLVKMFIFENTYFLYT
jgi:hypothetical protein